MDKKNGTKQGVFRCLCFLGAVILMLAGCGLYMRLTPDQTYSPQERRMLKKRPKLTKKRVLNGKFQKAYETYLCEQFPGRAHWVTMRTQLTRLLGQRDANGVYFGADGYLLEKYQEQDFDWKQVEKNVRRVKDFLQEYPNARVMYVPAKSSVLSEKLPPFAEASAEARFYEMVARQVPVERQISVPDILHSHRGEYIYYRTDHHWTTLGAYYAYEHWAQSMGISPMPLEQFNRKDVCDTFLGTTYAKVRTGGEADTISVYEPKEGISYQVDYNMGQYQSESFYDFTKVEGDDPYSVFFGGNQPLVDIQADFSGKAKGKKTLMIIKDSFGNCFAPFVANHYKRTIVVDLRHVNIPVSSLLSVYPADDILILYNSVQFMEDKDISKLR